MKVTMYTGEVTCYLPVTLATQCGAVATVAESRLILASGPVLSRRGRQLPRGRVNVTFVTAGTTCGRWSVTRAKPCYRCPVPGVPRMLNGGVEPAALLPTTLHSATLQHVSCSDCMSFSALQ
ncbi:hypothetical protein E2C01_063850 [Portunus trituberculatus]|uniref:Uncharacterized protein n=1 Tax=Portunus trituberculatus TaxID=210409 RepID=A0A5B7HBL8_PORTR|nr:hypothetical protein [Portunus trituberculatus]